MPKFSFFRILLLLPGIALLFLTIDGIGASPADPFRQNGDPKCLQLFISLSRLNRALTELNSAERMLAYPERKLTESRKIRYAFLSETQKEVDSCLQICHELKSRSAGFDERMLEIASLWKEWKAILDKLIDESVERDRLLAEGAALSKLTSLDGQIGSTIEESQKIYLVLVETMEKAADAAERQLLKVESDEPQPNRTGIFVVFLSMLVLGYFLGRMKNYDGVCLSGFRDNPTDTLRDTVSKIMVAVNSQIDGLNRLIARCDAGEKQ
ncbi:MAG: hypothetical protein PHW04_01880 [Candidatus Wallbacteria bacterium]|nr:hypothetical protein [Candidatus Wallbacteria bacterium]